MITRIQFSLWNLSCMLWQCRAGGGSAVIMSGSHYTDRHKMEFKLLECIVEPGDDVISYSSSSCNSDVTVSDESDGDAPVISVSRSRFITLRELLTYIILIYSALQGPGSSLLSLVPNWLTALFLVAHYKISSDLVFPIPDPHDLHPWSPSFILHLSHVSKSRHAAPLFVFHMSHTASLYPHAGIPALLSTYLMASSILG